MGLRDLFRNKKVNDAQSSRPAPSPSPAPQLHPSVNCMYRENDTKDPLSPQCMTEVQRGSKMPLDEYKRITNKEVYGPTNSWGKDMTDMRGHGDPYLKQEWNTSSTSMALLQPFASVRPSAATQRPPAGVPHQQAAPPPPAYSTEHLTDPKLKYIPSAEIQKAMNDEELQTKTARALKDYDIAFLLDDSSSMKRHWDHVKRLLGLLTDEAVKHDKNGIDLHFLNHEVPYSNLTSAKAVYEAMTKVNLQYGTPMAAALKNILAGYVSQLSVNAAVKCLNLIVITDGVPNDREEVKGIINEYADKLGRLNAPVKQVGIQFIQVGQSRSARQFLVSLDNDNYADRNKRRDLVDTLHLPELSTADKATMFKALVGGIDRLVDRNNVWGIGLHQAYDTREGLINGMSDAHMHVVPTHDGHGAMYHERELPRFYGGLLRQQGIPLRHGGHRRYHTYGQSLL